MRRVMDGGWELIDRDPRTGRTVWMYRDGAATHFRTDYPVRSLIEANAAARAAERGARAEGIGRRVASVPLNVFYDRLHAAQIQGDARHVARWLNDADHRAFRTAAGRV